MALAEPGKIAAAFAHALPETDYEQHIREMTGFDGAIRVFLTVAVSLAQRRCGGSLADEACERMLEDAVRRSGAKSTLVVGRINMENKASEMMSNRMGFEPLTEGPDRYNPDMREWYVVVDP
ncbi:hypothetical protein [[Kitasatospora] papulosa]|uniref:hypothetical protein n=1 Tax=[Kitasatospora] papulosa TaxID=1464011 RepID=UPI00364591F6